MYFLFAFLLMTGSVNNCELCHSDLKVEFLPSVHAREGISCVDCHGGNPAMDNEKGAHAGAFRSWMDRKQIPNACASCHSDESRMKAYGLPTDQLALYHTSVHGKRLAAGDLAVAVCTDCHGVHRVLPPTDPESPTHPRNIPKTCGTCHSDKQIMSTYKLSAEVVSEFERSVHGKALSQGNQQAPVCTSCHGTHGAAPPGIGDVSIVCGHCHQAERNSFRLSAHAGAMAEAGIPECAGCHGNHLVEQTGVGLWTTRCADCHSPDSDEVKGGLAIRQKLEEAEKEINLAQAAIQEATQIPLDVSDYEARLEEARTYMVQVLPVTHSLRPGDTEDLTRRARSIAVEIREEVGEKQEIFRTRKVVLIVIWFYILLTIVIIYQFKKQLESPSKTES
jgi:hypothetical protein